MLSAGKFPESPVAWNSAGPTGVNVSGCSESTWGPNRIADNLLPGETANIQLTSEGCYDVRVLFASNPSNLASIEYYSRQVVVDETTSVAVSE